MLASFQQAGKEGWVRLGQELPTDPLLAGHMPLALPQGLHRDLVTYHLPRSMIQVSLLTAASGTRSTILGFGGLNILRLGAGSSQVLALHPDLG